MNLLAIDTAAAACGIGVRRGETVLCRAEPMERGHAEALLPLINAVMAEAGLTFASLDAIAVSAGPGAFTGLRIGLAVARGLALAANRPCYGVPTLQALAAGVRVAAPVASPILAVLDSKRGDVYAQAFTATGTPLAPPRNVAAEMLPALLLPPAGAEVVVAGDVVAVAVERLAAAGVAARAAGVGPVAIVAGVLAIAEQHQRHEIGPLAPPRPLYLRPPATGPRLAM